MNEQYLLAVPSNTLVRDLDAAAAVLRWRGATAESPFPTRGQLDEGGEELDADRGSTGREGSAGGRGA